MKCEIMGFIRVPHMRSHAGHGNEGSLQFRGISRFQLGL